MTAVDSQILIYAHRSDAPMHREAVRALRKLAEGTTPWAIVVQSLHEFIGIVTHPRRFSPPSKLDDAIGFVNSLLQSPTLRLIAEGPSHWEMLQPLLRQGKVAGPLVHDARIVAVCLQHGVNVLWTCDRDFLRFPKLKAVNPLVQD